MDIYFVLSIFIVLINLLPVRNNREYSIRLVFSLFILFIYGAFRIDYGLDYTAYEIFFNEVKLYGLEANERLEVGYYFLNKLLPSYRSLLIIQTSLLCSAYFYLFKWYIPSKWAWFGFLLLFINGQFTIFFMLTAIRNGISVSIFILSTYFIYQRKIIPYLLLIFIAFWFHKSIIIYAPIAYIIANPKNFTKKNILTWLIILIIIALTLSTFLLDFANIFVNRYFTHYTQTLDNALALRNKAGLLASLFAITTSTLLLLIMKNKHLSEKETMLVKLSLLFLMANLLGPLNMRMTQYFASFFMAGSIIVAYTRSNNLLKYAYLTSISLYLLYALKIWIEGPYFSFDTYRSIIF